MPGERITVETQDAAAAPAALVASWIAGELTAFPDLVLTLDGDIIELDVSALAAGERTSLRTALDAALAEPRFDGWSARPS